MDTRVSMAAAAVLIFAASASTADAARHWAPPASPYSVSCAEVGCPSWLPQSRSHSSWKVSQARPAKRAYKRAYKKIKWKIHLHRAARPPPPRQVVSRPAPAVAATRVVPSGPISAVPEESPPDLVAIASRYLGAKGAQFGRPTLWCARFMNHVLAVAGLPGTGSDMARSFMSYGRRVPRPERNDILVMSRGRSKTSGHVAIIKEVLKSGRILAVSGNYRRRVAEATYPPRRVIAVVRPPPRAG